MRRMGKYPKGCVNLQTDVRWTYQFGGLFYGKVKGYSTKDCPSGNDGQLSERKQCKGQGRNRCQFHYAGYDVIIPEGALD